MTRLAKLVLLLLLIAPSGGCTGTDVDNFVGFVDIFLGEDEPEKTESEKWLEKQQKKQKKWEQSLNQKSPAENQAEDKIKQQRVYFDCQQKYIAEGMTVMREKCDGLRP